MARYAIAGFFVLVVACGVRFGVASADSADELARAGAFGFDETTHVATQATALRAAQDEQGFDVTGAQQLCEISERDISAGLCMIDEHEAAASARAEADDKEVLERVEKSKAKQREASAEQAGEEAVETAESAADSGSGLPEIDWTCGKEAFVEEWARRIDVYLSGSALDGYGAVFAEAAWNNGIDPRWSPAISNTESGKGKACIRPYNAWGWGAADYDPRGLAKEWASWETAIRDHVAGLARIYGYSITPEAASIYCPPNHAKWYSETLEQMALI